MAQTPWLILDHPLQDSLPGTLPFNEAIHIAENRLPSLTQIEIEKMAEEILGRIVDCAMPQIEHTDIHPELTAGDTPFSKTSKTEEKVISQVLSHIFGETISRQQKDAFEKLFTVRLDLQPAEQLLLKLCYRDGVSQVDAGKILGLNRFQINGRIRRTLDKIRSAFTEAGLADELQLILSNKDT